MLLTTIRSHRALSANRSTRRAAFTLLEVLIVVAILVILAGAASVALFSNLEKAKIGRAKTDMRIIEQAINQYYLENSKWPEQLVQIAPNINQGQQGLIDPWGQMYTFEIIGMTDETDGTQKERPVVYCQPPDPSKPRIQWPEK